MGRRERGGILRKETSCPWEGRRGVMSLDKGRELGGGGGGRKGGRGGEY